MERGRLVKEVRHQELAKRQASTGAVHKKDSPVFYCKSKRGNECVLTVLKQAMIGLRRGPC